jgi:hypothetical protein
LARFFLFKKLSHSTTHLAGFVTLAQNHGKAAAHNVGCCNST